MRACQDPDRCSGIDPPAYFPLPVAFGPFCQGWRLHVPSVEVVNAIGAGDVCTAVFLYHLAKARAQQSGDGGDGGDGDGGGDGDVGFASREADAFAWGLAAACARCAHEQPHFERAEAEAMRRRIRIEAL
eukprot:556304-Pleurochrysis_carterae.AAC.2